ncbi:MAG: deoxyribose-phosphate aldolase [Nitrospirae bacterium]|nr:deoxyribose-phosphate aldolase [Nitrospirota bacterium]MBI5695015.1 deoxyribose-phosphate aldolase [Nitrospirota bacterium]
MDLARVIDHTLLKSTATPADIDRLCDEARQYSFWSVCVNPCYVARAAGRLKDTGIKVCSVVAFPLGCGTTPMKVMEGVEAVRNGAAELDVVMNVGLFKAGEYEAVARDIKDFIVLTPGVVHKVIIETCYLTDAEKAGAARLAAEVGAEFVKTSTGFGPGGAKSGDVALMKEAAIGKSRVKAAGGIKDLDTLVHMVQAGAERIGTSSGVAIVEEFMARHRAKQGPPE